MVETSSQSKPEDSSPALSLDEGAGRLGLLGLGARISGAEARIWRDVISERWLTGLARRADIMGALSDPALLVAHGRPAWSRTSVVDAWLHPDDPLPSSVLWFEWDRPRDAHGSALERPLVSVCVADEVLGSSAERRVPNDPVARMRLIERTLELFEQSEAGPCLRALVGQLPDRAALTHLAGLRPRGYEGLRLVFWMTAAKLRAWLHACAWPGPFDEMVPLLAASAAPFRKLGVQLEIRGGELQPYLGLETPEYSYRPSSVQFRAWISCLRELGVALNEPALHALCASLQPNPQPAWCGPDRLYLKAAYDGRWHAKAYVAAGGPNRSGQSLSGQS